MKNIKFILIFLFISHSSNFAQQFNFKMALHLFTIPEGDTSQIQIKGAKSLSVDLSGFIYLADTGNNRIFKFSSDGELVKSIGGFGWEKEQFYTPVDIFASSGLDVFIADYDNQRVQRYDKDLNYISSQYSDENWEERFRFGYPKSVALSRHGDLFILDGENNRLLKLDSFGEPELSFGDYSEGKGMLLDPVQLAISPADGIFVTDRQANKIFVFDYFGNYLSEFGAGFLNTPTGIFYSNSGLIFVADTGNKRIVIFTKDGELVFNWVLISKKSGNFINPVDMVSYGQRVYVLDENRVQVFELK